MTTTTETGAIVHRLLATLMAKEGWSKQDADWLISGDEKITVTEPWAIVSRMLAALMERKGWSKQDVKGIVFGTETSETFNILKAMVHRLLAMLEKKEGWSKQDVDWVLDVDPQVYANPLMKDTCLSSVRFNKPELMEQILDWTDTFAIQNLSGWCRTIADDPEAAEFFFESQNEETTVALMTSLKEKFPNVEFTQVKMIKV